MMAFEIILVLALFTGIDVEAKYTHMTTTEGQEIPVHPGVEMRPMIVRRTRTRPKHPNACMDMVKFEDEFESIIKLGGEDRLDLFCSNMSNFIRCINEAMESLTGLPVKHLVNHWLVKGTETGKALNIVLSLEEFINEICTDGTLLHREYLLNTNCFQGDISSLKIKQCKKQGLEAFEIFKKIQMDRQVVRQTDQCVNTAYQLGCYGAALQEICGDEALIRYKNVIKKLGIFRSGICSKELMNTLKTTFLAALDMSDARKAIFRAIFEEQKRRK